MLHLLLFYNVEHIYGVLFLVVCLLYIAPRLAQQVIAQVKKKYQDEAYITLSVTHR